MILIKTLGSYVIDLIGAATLNESLILSTSDDGVSRLGFGRLHPS